MRVGAVDEHRVVISCDRHELGDASQHPDPLAAHQAAGRLEVQVRADQRVQEPERLDVLDHLVVVRNDPEQRPVIVTEIRAETLSGPRDGRLEDPADVLPVRALDYEQVALADLPAEAGLLEGILDA